MTPWQDLRVCRASGARVYGAIRTRILATWRDAGGSNVTLPDGSPAWARDVSWEGFAVAAPRRGGKGGKVPESKRKTPRTTHRIGRDGLAALDTIVAHTGWSKTRVITCALMELAKRWEWTVENRNRTAHGRF